ncbi:MAG: hypothetical protein JWN14_2868 [Chthonomonadales bacterium]|nr:hypothetical protein [Chthonomonadales bacterium]
MNLLREKNMRGAFLILGVMALLLGYKASHAQKEVKEGHRVVFEVNVDGQETWTGILNNVENLQKGLGAEHTQIEVVAHGKGLSLLLKTDTMLQERLQRISQTGVVFAACENTMRRKDVKKEDLLPLATTVPSGITEVVRKQETGWSYIKGGG